MSWISFTFVHLSHFTLLTKLIRNVNLSIRTKNQVKKIMDAVKSIKWNNLRTNNRIYNTVDTANSIFKTETTIVFMLEDALKNRIINILFLMWSSHISSQLSQFLGSMLIRILYYFAGNIIKVWYFFIYS